jgi:heptosyltransferase III
MLKEEISTHRAQRAYYFFRRTGERIIRMVFSYRNRSGRKLVRHSLSLRRSYLINYFKLRMRIAMATARAPERKTVVISQIVHMGDIVACEPVIRHVRQVQPDAFIILALQKNYRELADTHPEVDHTLALECVTEWIKFASVPCFDEVIDLNVYERACAICHIPWRKLKGSGGVTVSNYYLFPNLLAAFTASAAITVAADAPRMYVSRRDIEFVDALNLPDKYVCLHAASNEIEREFPVEKWRKVVEHIRTRWKIPVVEIGLKTALSLEKSDRSLCGQLSIMQSAEVIRRSLLYLGSDSGPAHLANAVGAYGIILLGQYRYFKKYMPYTGNYGEGKNSELIYHEGTVADLPVDRVLAAIDRRLAKTH